MFTTKNWGRLGVSLLVIGIFAWFLNGCARWPDEPNGGGGTGQKQLIVKVEIDNDGMIDPDNGNYYLVFNTDQDASFAPDAEIKNWEKGYYYLQLGNIGFVFGEVLEVDPIDGSIDSSWIYYTGTIEDDYFTVSIDLEDLGNPDEISLNVITTDMDNDTYDSLDLSFDTVIQTNVINSTNIIDDYSGDSEGGSNFDLIQVTATIITP